MNEINKKQKERIQSAKRDYQKLKDEISPFIRKRTKRVKRKVEQWRTNLQEVSF